MRLTKIIAISYVEYMMLQTFMTDNNIKQKRCAEVLEISQAHLSLILSGKKRPSLDLAVRIETMTAGAVPVASWVDDHKGKFLPDCAGASS